MSCVIGIVENDVVYMGADSGSSDDDHNQVVRKTEKVFIKRESGLTIGLGFAGAYSVGNFLQWHLNLPTFTRGLTIDEYIHRNLVFSIKRQMESAGIDFSESEIMVGANGRIFTIESDFGVVESIDNYDVCGSGHTYALGALRALYEIAGVDPEVQIKIALRATANYCGDVKPPFIVIEIPSKRL